MVQKTKNPIKHNQYCKPPGYPLNSTDTFQIMATSKQKSLCSVSLSAPVGQLFSRVRLSAASWTAARRASLSIASSWSLFTFMSIKSVMPSNHPVLCHPLLLLPSIFPSIRAFSNESVLCIKWPKYWSFSFSISPSNDYSGLISFRMDWIHAFSFLIF